MYEYLDKRYALALYTVAEEKGKVEEYLNDLREIVSLMKNDSEFLKVIKYPQISTSAKKKMFIRIFKGKIDEDLLSFLLILIEKDRILFTAEKLKQMEKIHLERNNTLMVVVKTVIPLKETERENLRMKLYKMYDKKIIFDERLDKSVIGGVYIRVGDDVIDGTIKSKLEEMKKLMFK
ncbi:F0F1 ATP synthase subunit delta [Clostridium sp. CM028]|uniref:F0F1 ATP synthase subunit delta n=1 Tax=unclassified Clostridium TaxID=2614128 RepID=UPI001C0C3435|nr:MULTISPECIES: F0F1 ATP synthase subunit delta [unclassified Clostridium]MBU3092556.1 F0F1 ATP synthase subunit delta [Clostridium sp. CF011]MBW9146243.1 F0F1 ATP synthase subunit delta [Clostridium sp. CM027]MBW9149715.1 F0F1 ATP synthase subunit delta [Clostridium sp. CM028]UVE39778.1 F0F1 ATP synthase subunit delta [Clostridium sp. CM027]WAG68685.1 F0F1 ATP synthase subunit delta [Clostridium sp. CF011]